MKSGVAVARLAEVNKVQAFLQMQRSEVVLKGSSREVQLHTDHEGRLGSSEMQDWNSGLGPFLRVLVAVETFLDLVLIHVTESGHLVPGSFREASVEPAALLARVPDDECLPAWQDLLLQKLDAVGPDGGPSRPRQMGPRGKTTFESRTR